ncbi:hypothetical protein CBOM_00969 [Ceraceosorus bombacis]|uniref:Uncharacterized protein n=1 Tax=Ceraceosorus bombacis TaxID=401625 RepID=A0A0P1BAS5_9BASI|nr:hypothetical protein CBOM_00969 [Ceraceosorus bombacis]
MTSTSNEHALGMQSLHDLDEWLSSNLPNVHALPQKVTNSIHEYTTILYTSLTQYGPPTLPHIPSLPSLPDFVAGPSKPAPPPPPQSIADRLARWWRDHPHAIVLLSRLSGGLHAAGAALFAGVR